VSETVRLLSTREAIVRGLMSICEKADPGADTYRLSESDHRIDRLIDFIVAFEIDIQDCVGRFKVAGSNGIGSTAGSAGINPQK
jgi:hypothetical protein